MPQPTPQPTADPGLGKLQRKFRKLVRDPSSFLSDSNHESLRWVASKLNVKE